MKNLKMNVILLSISASLAACSFVSLDPQAKDIIVSSNASNLNNCKFVGNTNVSLWDKAGTFQSQEKTESQLNILARNQAATMGGNTVVAESATADAVQKTYRVYNCVTTNN